MSTKLSLGCIPGKIKIFFYSILDGIYLIRIQLITNGILTLLVVVHRLVGGLI